MTEPAARTFGDALAAQPLRAFQLLTLAVCMGVLVSDGIDMQLLGILAPLVIADFGVDRSTFGIAMSAALVGFGAGAWGGGWLGDRAGRRWALALAALVFALATVGASRAGGVWPLAWWRVVGGLGFGAAYSNTLAMAGEWLPERWRPVALATLSVGTPVGGTVAGWLGPGIAAAHGWRGAFVTFGLATLLLVAIILAALRDSPSFLLARGRRAEAERIARRVLPGDLPLLAETREASSPAGVLGRENRRFNTGIGLAFAACAVAAYGILNWTTTFLTSHGFSLAEAGRAISIAGLTSMAGSVAAGALTRALGSRRVLLGLATGLFVVLAALAAVVEGLPAVPDAGARLLTVTLIGMAGALFSAGIATMYVVMTFGYPAAYRSAGIGFGIFMSRVGAVAASGFGGVLLEMGHGSVVPFFAVLAAAAAAVGAGALVIDRHVPARPR